MADMSPSPYSSPGSPVHAELQHPSNQRRAPQQSPADIRSPQHPTADSQRSSIRDTSAPATYGINRQQSLARNHSALSAPSTAADSATLDAATAAIARARTSFDVGDTSLLNDLCERLSNPDLYTRPITRQRIIELLEIASEEIAKTRAAGLWEITARVAQERHFVCPPQMEGTVKNYIKMVDTVNENLDSFDEDDLIARLSKINQSKPFQTNIPANTACFFCRRRKIKCNGSLPQCDMCAKHRQAKCEYPPKSQYGGFPNRGGLHYVVPMGPDIAAAAASAAPGASPPAHLDPGKPVKGYAPLAPTAVPTFILPGPLPSSSMSNSTHTNAQQPSHAPAPGRRSATQGDNAHSPRTGMSRLGHVQQGRSLYQNSHSLRDDNAASEGRREKGSDKGFGDEDDDARPASSTSSQMHQNPHPAHTALNSSLTGNGNQDVEIEDGQGENEAPRRRSPHNGHERCINCDTDKTSLWRKDEDGRTICNACQIYFRVHGRKRPPSMRSSTVKKRPGRQPRPSAAPHLLPGQDAYVHDDAADRHPPDAAHHILRPSHPHAMAHAANSRPAHSPASSGSHSPPLPEYAQQRQHLRAAEQATTTNGQRTHPTRAAGDYALGGSRRGQGSEGYRARATDYVERPISPEARSSSNRAHRHNTPPADAPVADEDWRRPSRRISDEHRGEHLEDQETEVQAGENLCAVEGGRSPADVLVFRFDADRAKSVCATQWAHLRSPNRLVEDDLRFHLNCYRKNPPEASSSDRVTLGVATDWLPKAGVYSITSGDEPPTSHHMAPPPQGKLNSTIDITGEIREGLNTLKFTQLRDMSDCVLVVQIWKVGRKGAHPPPRGSLYSGISPPGSIPDRHSRGLYSTRGPAHEAGPSLDLPLRRTPPLPGRGLRNGEKSNGASTPISSRRSCLYCFNNQIACRPGHRENLGCEECLRRGIQCAMPEEYSPELGYHASVDRKPMVDPTLPSPSSHAPVQGPPMHIHHSSTPMSPDSVSGSKRKLEEQLPVPGGATNKSKRPFKRKPAASETTPPPASQPALPPMHHIQHVPPPSQSGYAAALGGSNGSKSNSSADARASQDLKRHQEQMQKQREDAERESARVLAGGLPTPYA